MYLENNDEGKPRREYVPEQFGVGVLVGRVGWLSVIRITAYRVVVVLVIQRIVARVESGQGIVQEALERAILRHHE